MFGGMERYHLPSSPDQHFATRAEGEERRRTGNLTSEASDTCGEDGGQLTMGIIGCLPDNVQQAIKSFSIRRGKQHVTFAFPFMEDLIRRFDQHRAPFSTSSRDACNKTFVAKDEQSCGQKFQSITPVLFFDKCPEIIYGFETLVTLVPSANRSSHLIGLLTLNQKGTLEGFRRHIESLFRMMVSGKTASELNNLPLLALDLKGRLLQEALDAGTDAVLEVHGDVLARTYPGKTPQQLLHLIKEKIIRPVLVPYHEVFHLNIQEVETRLRNQEDRSSTKRDEDVQRLDSTYFHSLVELLKSPTCSPAEFRQIHVYFMSPTADSAVQEFWSVWSHEQVAAKVFPVSLNKTRIGSFHYFAAQGDMCLNQALLSKTQSAHNGAAHHLPASVLGSVMTRVPVKEGLISVIKCLKNQDLGISSVKGEQTNPTLLLKEEINTECSKTSKECNCGNGLPGKSVKERAVTRSNLESFGTSRAIPDAAGSQSAFHPPRSSNFNQQLWQIPHSLAVVKPTTSYPASSAYYTSKSLPDRMVPDIGRQEILALPSQGTAGLLPLGMAPFPFLLGYYGPIKNGSPGPPTHPLPTPVISLQNAPLLCCHWKSFDHEMAGNW